MPNDIDSSELARSAAFTWLAGEVIGTNPYVDATTRTHRMQCAQIIVTAPCYLSSVVGEVLNDSKS